MKKSRPRHEIFFSFYRHIMIFEWYLQILILVLNFLKQAHFTLPFNKWYRCSNNTND
jgi:hypothetical protein